jgi:hypothetical protein
MIETYDVMFPNETIDYGDIFYKDPCFKEFKKLDYCNLTNTALYGRSIADERKHLYFMYLFMDESTLPDVKPIAIIVASLNTSEDELCTAFQKWGFLYGGDDSEVVFGGAYNPDNCDVFEESPADTVDDDDDKYILRFPALPFTRRAVSRESKLYEYTVYTNWDKTGILIHFQAGATLD